VLTYPYTQFSDRQARLGLSGRKGLRAREVLEQNGLVLTLAIGQSLFLIPAAQGYRAFGQEPPQVRRGISPEHSFLCQLARHLLLEQPHVSRVEAEVPVGESGATVDLVVHRKDGGLEAWEVTSSVSNITGNAIKCSGEGFQRVVFLCRDYSVRQAVWKRIQASGLPRDLRGRIRCVLFSSLGRKGGKK
jgi:hypothetical protein